MFSPKCPAAPATVFTDHFVHVLVFDATFLTHRYEVGELARRLLFVQISNFPLLSCLC